MSTAATETMTGYELRITRVFDAPRELVWKAWTDPEMAKEWMGPRGFQATAFETTDKLGGRWRMVMEGHRPGTDVPVVLVQGGTIKEIKPPELLVYTFAWEPRAAVGLPESPFKENVVTLRLEERGGKTIMHFTQAPFATEGERDGHVGGWNSAFDRFAEFMLREQPERKPGPDDVPMELHLRRLFAAPRQLVFDAWTKPEMMREWWGPANFTVPVCEVDACEGGEILIHMQGPDGTVYPMTGRFLAIYPPYRFNFSATPLDEQGKEMFETWISVLFEERDGGTEVVLDLHVTRSTPEAAFRLRGMRTGWSQSLEKLAAFVEERRQ